MEEMTLYTEDTYAYAMYVYTYVCGSSSEFLLFIFIGKSAGAIIARLYKHWPFLYQTTSDFEETIFISSKGNYRSQERLKGSERR